MFKKLLKDKFNGNFKVMIMSILKGMLKGVLQWYWSGSVQRNIKVDAQVNTIYN